MTDATASRNSDLTCGARYGEAVRSAVGSLARFFAAPTNSPRELHIRPRLASWDAGTAPSQIALTAALDHAVEILQADSREPAGPVAVRLDVGLPEGTNPLGVYDLDNYLFPIVTRLGKLGVPVVSAWGTKSIGATSTIRACTAVAVELPPGAIQKIRTDTSSETAAFKLQIADQLAGNAVLPEGPGALQLSFTVGPRRVWTNLWKPTIDALGHLLGRDHTESRPWHPRDGRIAELGLHYSVDPGMKNSVEISIVTSTILPPAGVHELPDN